jgi:hypothetical protein
MVLTMRVNAKTSDETKLVFRRYGDQYFFAEAQVAGEQSSLATLKSRAERAQERALGARRNTLVTVIAE